MPCCGQSGGRVVLNQKDIDEGLRFEVEYWGGRPIEIAGAVTGHAYQFSGLSRTGYIDPRDAPSLLRNSSFRLKGAKKIELTSSPNGGTN